MLLGAQNAWGTYYYRGDANDSGSGWGATEMLECNGAYSITFKDQAAGLHQFKITNSNSAWEGTGYEEYNKSAIQNPTPSGCFALTGGNGNDYNIYYTLDAAATVTIFLSSDKKVSARIETFHSVKIKVTSTNNLRIHTWDNFGNKYSGEWADSPYSSSSSSPWEYNISVPENVKLSFNLRNTGNPTIDIEAGRFNSDGVILSYTVSDDLQTITAPTYLAMSNNSWVCKDLFSDGSVTLSLDAKTTYTFKVVNMSNYYGIPSGTSADIYWDNCTNRSVSTASGNQNCVLHTYFAGDYTFAFDGSNLSITYPTTSYTAYFKNTNSWGDVYAHAWLNYEGNDHPVTGAWHGKKITTVEDGFYVLSIDAAATPSMIIWNDGSSIQTAEFAFVNGGKYNANGPIYTIAFTPSGYATFCSEHQVTLPEDVTAYTGQYADNKLTLSELTGTYANVIPANLAVVLKSTQSPLVNIELESEATTENVASYTANDKLVGTTTAIDRPSNACYVLGYVNPNTAFYHFTGESIPANKAYILLDNPISAPGVRIIEEAENATAIHSLDANAMVVKFIENGQLLIRKDGVVYDMTGRVVR